MNVGVIPKTFEQLYGQPCWGLHDDSQLNLSINFGQPSLDIREPFQTSSNSEIVRRMAARRCVTVRGEWWLWFHSSYWRISSQNQRLATSSSSDKQIDRAMRHLDGQKLISAQVHPKTGATRFVFDLGGVLECRRFERDSDRELWNLYKPSGYVLCVYGNGTFTHQRGTTARQAAHHRRISDGRTIPS